MQTGNKTINKEYLVERLADWHDRIEKLYADILRWKDELGVEGEVRREEIPETAEELMIKYEITPGTVPALAIIRGKLRISFIPMGLWVIGANGRLNIVTNTHRYILVDMGDESLGASQWQIANPLRRRHRVDFDKDAFAKLLRDEDLCL